MVEGNDTNEYFKVTGIYPLKREMIVPESPVHVQPLSLCDCTGLTFIPLMSPVCPRPLIYSQSSQFKGMATDSSLKPPSVPPISYHDSFHYFQVY